MSSLRSMRAYRLIVLIAPRRLRERHAAEMEALFDEALSKARESGQMAVTLTWVAAAWDLLRARGREPFRPSLPLPGAERRAFMFGSDLRYTVRWLLRQKSSTALVVSMLALGIAANVVVFSLVNGLFLRPFAFPEAERLVYVNTTAPRWNLDVVGKGVKGRRQFTTSRICSPLLPCSCEREQRSLRDSEPFEETAPSVDVVK